MEREDGWEAEKQMYASIKESMDSDHGNEVTTFGQLKIDLGNSEKKGKPTTKEFISNIMDLYKLTTPTNINRNWRHRLIDISGSLKPADYARKSNDTGTPSSMEEASGRSSGSSQVHPYMSSMQG